MKSLLFLIILLISSAMSIQDSLPAYFLFEKGGRHTTYDQMLQELKDVDIILFGEYHENPIAHWIQRTLVEDLYELRKDELILGAEMLEADNQLILNEYISGMIPEKKFEEEARLWKNHRTDYKPILSFAAKNRIPVVATNIPRRYASLVYTKGFEILDSLDKQAHAFMAPLPPLYDENLACYKDLLNQDNGDFAGHANPNLPKSQAIKDATMAHFILENFKKGKIFLHLNGAYHSDNYEGIYWYLKQRKPNLRIVTISTVEQKNLDELGTDNLKLADFVLAVDEKMTKTH